MYSEKQCEKYHEDFSNLREDLKNVRPVSAYFHTLYFHKLLLLLKHVEPANKPKLTLFCYGDCNKVRLLLGEKNLGLLKNTLDSNLNRHRFNQSMYLCHLVKSLELDPKNR